MMAARPPAVRAAATVRPAATAPSPTAKSLPLAPAGTASNFAWSGKKTATLYRVTAPAGHLCRLVPLPVKCAVGAAILTIEWLDGDRCHARTLYRNPTRRE
jgi:hypothetical protein